MADEKELQVQEHSTPAVIDTQALMMKALETGADVEKLERLMDLAERMKAAYAREEYYSSLSGFQSTCPEIKKTKIVYQTEKGSGRKVIDKDGNPVVRYRYAPLDSIVAQVKKPLKKYGFSYTIVTEQNLNVSVTATVIVQHISGHSERTSFVVPIDTGYMNEIQKVASALTYAKRYAFCNAFGIMTADMDDDANYGGERDVTPKAEPVKKIPEENKKLIAEIKALTKDKIFDDRAATGILRKAEANINNLEELKGLKKATEKFISDSKSAGPQPDEKSEKTKEPQPDEIEQFIMESNLPDRDKDKFIAEYRIKTGIAKKKYAEHIRDFIEAMKQKYEREAAEKNGNKDQQEVMEFEPRPEDLY